MECAEDPFGRIEAGGEGAIDEVIPSRSPRSCFSTSNDQRATESLPYGSAIMIATDDI